MSLKNYHVMIFQTSISKPGDADIVGLAVINTIIGGSAGGIVVLFFNKFVLGQKWSYLMTLNGALTGNFKVNKQL